MADQDGIRSVCGSKTVGLQYVPGFKVYDWFTWQSQNSHGLRIAFNLGSYLSTLLAGYKAALFSTVLTNDSWLVMVHPTIGWLLFSI